MTAKICGIRSEQDLDTAIRAGANAVGFLVGLTHYSEDLLSTEEAKTLIRQVPPFVVPVLVTHLPVAADIVALHNELGTGAIQLHGEMTLDEVANVRRLLPQSRLIKALHVTDEASMPTLMSDLAALNGLVNAVLLDSRTIDRLGGTGQPHDWTLSRRIRQASSLPVILAGGLNADNVAAAIDIVRPAGVDVNSGVEDARGNKDFAKCSGFVDGARTAQLTLVPNRPALDR